MCLLAERSERSSPNMISEWSKAAPMLMVQLDQHHLFDSKKAFQVHRYNIISDCVMIRVKRERDGEELLTIRNKSKLRLHNKGTH